MKKPNVLLIAALAVLCAAPSLAQQRPSPGQPGGPYDDGAFAGAGQDRGAPAEERREEVRRKMEAVRIMRLTESLKLDERTAAKFIPIITALEQKRRDLLSENQQTMRELRAALTAQPPEERALKSAMERMIRNHQEMVKLRDREIEAAKENLTAEQQARYLLFQQDFMREMRGMIEDVRGGRGTGPGMRGGRGPGPRPRDRQY